MRISDWSSDVCSSDLQPDLTPIRRACETIGRALHAGQNAIVCFESTVYPGVTEDICGPLLEQVSGLKHGADFHLAYSPERINPGDRERTLRKIAKVVSGDSEIGRAHVCTPVTHANLVWRLLLKQTETIHIH